MAELAMSTYARRRIKSAFPESPRRLGAPSLGTGAPVAFLIPSLCGVVEGRGLKRGLPLSSPYHR